MTHIVAVPLMLIKKLNPLGAVNIEIVNKHNCETIHSSE